MTSFSIPTLSLSALCAALALLPPTVNGQEEGVSKGAIGKALRSPNSLIRHDTWTKMNPEEKSQFSMLVKIMAIPGSTGMAPSRRWRPPPATRYSTR